MEEKHMDAARKKRKQAYARAYYQAHREEIRRQQREYYQSQDKAAHAARVRAYREKNREHCREVQREYRRKNQERIQELGRRYRERNAARIRENRRRYEAEHREELREKKRAYVAAHREEIRLRNQAYREAHREQRREQYQRNRSEMCRRTLEDYTFRSIQRIQERCPERVAEYLERWPFAEFAERRIYWQIHQMGVRREDQRFDACFDAGMVAYLYSIHRCACMGYEHVYAYIRKMIRILVICALNAYPDAERLCAENQLRLEHLEEWEGVTL